MTYVNALSEIEDPDADGAWCDLVFDIVKAEMTREATPFNGLLALVGQARGTANGEVIGIGFAVPLDNWQSGKHEKFDFHWGQVVLESIGPETDKLVRLYERWFGFPLTDRAAAPVVRCSAVALESGPPAPADRPTRMKLFFEPLVEEGLPEAEAAGLAYAELFFGIDLPGKRIRLNEKDPEYRQGLVAYLTSDLVSYPSVPLVGNAD